MVYDTDLKEIVWKKGAQTAETAQGVLDALPSVIKTYLGVHVDKRYEVQEVVVQFGKWLQTHKVLADPLPACVNPSDPENVQGWLASVLQPPPTTASIPNLDSVLPPTPESGMEYRLTADQKIIYVPETAHRVPRREAVEFIAKQALSVVKELEVRSPPVSPQDKQAILRRFGLFHKWTVKHGAYTPAMRQLSAAMERWSRKT